MRVLVVGAGAVGSLLGWALAAAGEPVTIVRRGTVASTAGSIPVVRPGGTRTSAGVQLVGSIAEAARATVDQPGLVLLAVRQHDLPDVLRDLSVLPDAIVLTAQNGIGAEAAAADARPGRRVLAASLTSAVERSADGTVAWLRRGGIALAPVAGDVGTAGRSLASAFRRSGLPATWLEDWRSMKWSKLVANLVGNATSALLDMDPAAVYDDPRLLRLEHEQLLEALRVIDAQGLRTLDLPGAPVAWLARGVRLPRPFAGLALRRVVGRARGGKDPSLRIALALGGATEVAWLNGAVARVGAATGVATPVNTALARLVDQAAGDPARRAWFRQHPERLLEAIATG